MSGPPRLDETIDAYLQARTVRYSPSTVTNERFVLPRFAAWAGDIQVWHLRAERVEEWFLELLVEHRTRDGYTRPPIQANTHNFYRHRLAAFFRDCHHRGLIRDDLLRLVEPMRVDKKPRQQPAPHLLLAMLDATSNARDRCFLAVAINTGLRQGEIVRLRVHDVHLAEGHLDVAIGKTGDHDLQPITSDLDQELRRWLTQYSADLGRRLGEEAFLFPAATGPRYYSVTEVDGRGDSDTAPRPEIPSVQFARPPGS
ncbi:MAG: tyrosine-type recombinase/integrase [Nocardioidaceae bacterium]